MKRRVLILLSLLSTTWIVGYPSAAQAAVYNLHLTTDNGPDYTDMESFVRTVTTGCETPQEKCIAVWSWARRSRRQTSNANEGGRLIWDPILHYNSYGTMNCGVVSALNIASFLQLGYRARYIQLGDHTVSEVSWDDGKSWHLLDSSMSFFCFNHDGVIASCEEIKEAHACALSGGKSEPGHYYYYHGAPQCRSHLGPDAWRCAGDQPVAYRRTLHNGASSYTDGYSVSQYTQYGRSGRRYILNLLPGQSYTRYFRPLDRDNPDVTDADRPDYYRPLRDGDPNDQHGLNNIRGNGVWIFEPALAQADCRNVFYDDQGLATRGQSGSGPSLHPTEAKNPTFVVLKVSAANVITSMRIDATGIRTAPGDVLRVLVSRTAGIRWEPVWQSQSLGSQEIKIKLRDQVAGLTECLVKIEMSAAEKATDVSLDSIRMTTITQLNRRTLPKLTLGANRVRLSAGEQVESSVLWPPLHAGQYRQTVFEEEGVFSTQKPDGIYKATLGSAVNGKECQATWRMAVPTDIIDVSYGVVATNRSSASYVSLRQSFDGKNYSEFYRKSDGEFPFDQQVLRTFVADPDSPNSRETYLQCAFFCRGGAGTYGMDGIQDVLVRVRHQPRDAAFQPIEVTYSWTEHRDSGDVTRSHTQLVESLPYEYAINTAGFRDPTTNWVRVNLRGSDLHGPPVAYGYSDNEDVSPGFEPKRRLYDWGKNLARDKPYTVDRLSAADSNNADRDGRELTNGAVIAPTDITTNSMVQTATAFWAAGDPVQLVVDLGKLQVVAGARVSTHQPNADYCHPGRIDVAVSVDGRNWRSAGTIRHNDLFNPPTDYEPWEHDDNPKYDQLPAGGRLAYSFPLVFDQPLSARYVRFSFTPLEDRGMGISELGVFDRVSVQ